MSKKNSTCFASNLTFAQSPISVFTMFSICFAGWLQLLWNNIYFSSIQSRRLADKPAPNCHFCITTVICVFFLRYSMCFFLTRLGRILLQQILNDEMHHTKYDCADAENAERITATDFFHQIAAEQTSGRHSDSFEYSSDQSLLNEIVALFSAFSPKFDIRTTNLKRCRCTMWSDDIRVRGHCCIEQCKRHALHQFNW